MKKGLYYYMPFKHVGNGIYRAVRVSSYSTLSDAREAAKLYGLRDRNYDYIARYHVLRGMEDTVYGIGL